jgi:large subunit ribosomal protein L2
MGFRSFRFIISRSRRNILFSAKKKYLSKLEGKGNLYPNPSASGRNNSGVVTCRHIGGGHKRMYRKVDFFRKKLGCVGCVRSFVFDPNRKVNLALIFYDDGEKAYILAPKNLYIGQYIVTGFCVSIEIGNTLPIWNFPIGTSVHNVEINPGQGGQLSRAAGTSVQLVARNDGFVRMRLPSGESRFSRAICWSTRGQVGSAYTTANYKAGNTRWLGIRPRVRGSAINPVDHPHGGGEGRCPIGRPSPITPWGYSRLGVKTRYKKGYQVLKEMLKLFNLYYGSFVEKRSLCIS